MDNNTEEKPIISQQDLALLRFEREAGFVQKQKERRFFAIVFDALQKHQILSNDQIQEIKALEIF